MRRAPGDAVVLTGGQDGRQHRAHDAKYGRFAYSSAFAFSVQSDAWTAELPELSAVDNGMMVSRDAQTWVSRAGITEAGVDSGMVWGRWRPGDDLVVDTWLDFAEPGWHVRLHRIETGKALRVAEGGFAVDSTGLGYVSPNEWTKFARGPAFVRTRSAISGLLDLSGGRAGTVVRAAPNTNLRFPCTVFPRLIGEVPAGKSWLVTAAFAVPNPSTDVSVPKLPKAMRAVIARDGLDPSAFRSPRQTRTPKLVPLARQALRRLLLR